MLIKSNNIYNNLLNDDTELSDDEQMVIEMDFDESEELNFINDKFNKILGYDKKKYLDLIEGLEIYKDFDKLYKFIANNKPSLWSQVVDNIKSTLKNAQLALEKLRAVTSEIRFFFSVIKLRLNMSAYYSIIYLL